ncbi:MAG: aminotransferase class V-fold PLP-dependent enzyme [Candidatus Latescibacterota bacterium]
MFFDDALIADIQKEFPRAQTDPWGKRRVFLDNGTGTLVLKGAADAQHLATTEWNANPGDSFPESRKAAEFMRDGLMAIADLLNAEGPDNIISGQTATSLMFQISYALGREMNPRNNIVITYYEHLSNVDPWRELVNRGVAGELRIARLCPDGTLDLEHFCSLVDKNTKVVSVSAASNLLGSKSPLTEVCRVAREAGAYSVIDAVHHAAHGPLDVQAIGCDFLAISAYKFFTPKFIAFMYGKKQHLENLRSYVAGKNHASLQGRWHWGSPDQAKYAAVAATVEYLTRLGERMADRYAGRYTYLAGRKRLLKISLDAIEQYEKELSLAVMNGIGGVPGLRDLPNVKRWGLYDPNRLEERDPTFAFEMINLPGKEAERILVEERNIAMRSMLYWSMAEDFFGVSYPLRASLVHYNTPEDVKLFLEAVREMGRR